MKRKYHLLAAFALALCALAIPLLAAPAARPLAAAPAPLQDSDCYYSYRTLSIGSYDPSRGFPFKCGDRASQADALQQCIDYLDDLGLNPNQCNRSCRGCMGGVKPSGKRSSSSNSVEAETPNPSNDSSSSSDSSDADEAERARQRAKAYEAQKKGGDTSPPKESEDDAPLVQRPGESDEDFRARQRAAEYEQQKHAEKKAEEPKTVYVSSSCRANWKGWTFTCCATYTSKAECEQGGKTCVAYDPKPDQERTKNYTYAPACIGSE